jgi:hypothetical protein
MPHTNYFNKWSLLKSLIIYRFQNVLPVVTWSVSTPCEQTNPYKLWDRSNARLTLYNSVKFFRSLNNFYPQWLVPFISGTDIAKEECVLYWAEATGIVFLYVHFMTFSLGLDVLDCLYISGFQTEILCVFLISPVHFSRPICPTVFQFPTHLYSVTSTNHAASHCAILFILLLLPLSSYQISPSVSVLAQYFRVNSLEHKHKPNTNTNTNTNTTPKQTQTPKQSKHKHQNKHKHKHSPPITLNSV